MSDFRIGYGEDIHRLAKGDHLTLGGVRIPFEKGIVAHSDGDLVYHVPIERLSIFDFGQLRKNNSLRNLFCLEEAILGIHRLFAAI